MEPDSQLYDCIIIGGGFAGLTAAAWLGRYRRRTLIISSGPSRNHASRALHGYPGFEGGDPSRLLEVLRQEADRYNIKTVAGTVKQVKHGKTGFTVQANNRPYRARRLLLATGTSDRQPDVPHFADFAGTSAWHCPACDGFEYSGQRLAVISWGPQMAGYALELLSYTNDITVLTHGHNPGAPADHLEKLKANHITVRQSQIAAMKGRGGQVEQLLLADGTIIPCDAVFYSLSHQPRLELIKQLGCQTTDDCVVLNRKQETTVPGVYAAGDIAPLEELVVVAAAMGAVAASNIHKSLVPEHQRVE
ncbi:MAG TPA: NAD(P)/FAD-dependent oxidoreductase [Candidatus Saccharimonadales bacterium]|nr:NAD(P)/FAD-dependent oxidoreductase [Candidatus Saccharimonadales bacterium]